MTEEIARLQKKIKALESTTSILLQQRAELQKQVRNFVIQREVLIAALVRGTYKEVLPGMKEDS